MKLSARFPLRLRAAFSLSLGLGLSLSSLLASSPIRAQFAPSSSFPGSKSNPALAPFVPLSAASPQEWTTQWWRWAVSYPASRSPILDPHGEYVQEGDQGPTFSLAGNFGGSTVREATVRSDQWLLVPILTAAFWAPDQGQTEFELRAKAARFAESAESLFLTIDGQELPIEFDLGDGGPSSVGIANSAMGVSIWRRHVPIPSGTGSIPLRFAKGNPLGAGEGIKPTVVDGYFAMVPPLPPGLHEIRFGGRTPEFSQDSRYVIRSVPGPVAPLVKTMGFLGSSRRIDGLKIRFSQRLSRSANLDPKHWLIEAYHSDGGLGQTIRVTSIQAADPDRRTFVARFASPFALADLQAVRVTVRDSLSNLGGIALDGDRDGKPGGEFHVVYKTFQAPSITYVEPDGDRVRLAIEGEGRLEGLRLENGGLHQTWLVQPGRNSRLRAGFAPGSGPRSDGRASLLELIGTSRVDASQVLNHPAFRVRALTPDRNAEGF